MVGQVLCPDVLLPPHAAPRGNVHAGSDVVREHGDHLADPDVTHPSGELNDGERAPSTHRIDDNRRILEPRAHSPPTPAVSRNLPTTTGSTSRKRWMSWSVVVRVNETRMLP